MAPGERMTGTKVPKHRPPGFSGGLLPGKAAVGLESGVVFNEDTLIASSSCGEVYAA